MGSAKKTPLPAPRKVGWGDSWNMSEMDFPLSELRKLEEGGESFCSCMGLDTSPLRAPMNEIVLCCLLCLTSPETVPVRIVLYSHRNCLSRCQTD